MKILFQWFSMDVTAILWLFPVISYDDNLIIFVQFHSILMFFSD